MSCIICKKSNSKLTFKNLLKCNDCGLVYYEITEKDPEIEALYEEEYFTGAEYMNYKEDKLIIQKNFHSRLKDIRKYASGGTLYEIGCAYGFFLDIAKKYYTVKGIDVTKKPTEFARKKMGINVVTGNYIDKPLQNKVDVFCMWDTIEHLDKPEKFISKMSSELNVGGFVFLTTGDIGSLLARMRGSKWRMIHPPTHLFYFSKSTISKLLEQNGLEVVEITYPGVYRSLKQILYSMFFINSKKRPKIIEKMLSKFDIPIYLNTFDIMMVVAKKI